MLSINVQSWLNNKKEGKIYSCELCEGWVMCGEIV